MDGGTGVDTLIAQRQSADFIISGVDEGAMSGKIDQGFFNIQNLFGGIENDTFTFTNDGSLSGLVDGGGGDDTLIGDDDGNEFIVSAANQGMLLEKLGGGFFFIKDLIGGDGDDIFTINPEFLTGDIFGGAGNDTLFGDDGGNIIAVTGDNSGWLNADVDIVDVRVDYFEIENLNGGGGDDWFFLDDTGSLTGLVDGGTGFDAIVGQDDPNDFIISGVDEGEMPGKIGLGFLNIQRLYGRIGSDTFTFTNDGSLTGFLSGGEDTDSIFGDDNGNDFLVSGLDSGELIDKIGFFEIETLFGGSGDDSFTFTDNGSLSGSLNGGSGDNDTIIGGDDGNTFTMIDIDFGTMDKIDGGFEKYRKPGGRRRG